MNKTAEKKLLKIMKEVLGVDATQDLSMETVPGWDSLRHIQLMAKLEQAFNIEIDFRDTLVMTNLKSIKEILGKYVVEK